MLFGGSLIGSHQAAQAGGKVVINPLFVDDTDMSNDEMLSHDRHVTQLNQSEGNNANDKGGHFVTVFTISNGEMTFKRKGSQKWFQDGSTSTIHMMPPGDQQMIQFETENEAYSSGNEDYPAIHRKTPDNHTTCVDRKSHDRKSKSSCDRKSRSHDRKSSESHDRKYKAIPSCSRVSMETGDPARKYHRDALFKRKSCDRSGTLTDYGFIDSDPREFHCVDIHDPDRTSLGSLIVPSLALTDDEKVAQRSNSGSHIGLNSPDTVPDAPGKSHKVCITVLK